MGGNKNTEAIFRRGYIENIAPDWARAGEKCYSWDSDPNNWHQWCDNDKRKFRRNS